MDYAQPVDTTSLNIQNLLPDMNENPLIRIITQKIIKKNCIENTVLY